MNSVGEGADIVKAVNHPNIKLLVDIYHMLREGESPEEIIKAGKHIYHCHIAEKDKRTPPGAAGDDFKPYLRALKKINYSGWTEVFMHPVPRGIPIMPTAGEVTAQINHARRYLEKCLSKDVGFV